MVIANINYILDAKFTKDGSKYNVIIQYHSVLTQRALASTPYKYVANIDGKGKPIFNSARSSGMWYQKVEGKTGELLMDFLVLQQQYLIAH